MRPRIDLSSLGGLVLGFAIVAWAHVAAGGTLATLVQPSALVIVFGGTCAAILVSFPGAALFRAGAGIVDVILRPQLPADELVATFAEFARRMRMQGFRAIEDDIPQTPDRFLRRALNLAIAGMKVDVVRQALETEARVSAEREEEQAQVLEAAAGYAPTLGIIGAVLGLMHVLQQMTSPAQVGTGISAAFVATIYGIGAANLLFLPLATRLRARARVDGLRRELTIDGVVSLHENMHPSLIEERLAGYLRQSARRQPEAA